MRADEIATNRALIDSTLNIVAHGLHHWLSVSFDDQWPRIEHRDRREPVPVAPTDPSYLFGIFVQEWQPTLRHHATSITRTYVFELRDIRNRWAHHETLSYSDANRAIDTAARLMDLLDRPSEAAELRRLALPNLGAREPSSGSSKAALRVDPAAGVTRVNDCATAQPINSTTASWNRSFQLGKTGQVVEAALECKRLLDEQGRLLGMVHPDTLATRFSFGYWLGQAGKIQEALSEFASLVRDHAKILGPTHPNTLTCQLEHAKWLGVAGDFEVAASVAAQVADQRVRIFGARHVNTLVARADAAILLASSGQRHAGIELLERTIHDQDRFLGGDHPDTLRSLANRARFLGLSDEGIAEIKKVIDQGSGFINSYSPEVFEWRNFLVVALDSVGRKGEATVEKRQLLHDLGLAVERPDSGIGPDMRFGTHRWLSDSGGCIDDSIERSGLGDQ